MQKRTLTAARLTGCVAALALGAAATGCSSSSAGGGKTPFAIGSIKPAANDPSFRSPFDATPDPSGQTVYFTALSANGPGVFKAAASGGNVKPLAVGDPLVSPFSIAVSSDGNQLFVADLGAETSSGDAGAVFSLSTSGGTPSLVTGTDGMQPHGIEVAADTLYFTGKGKDGKPGVFSMPVAGGAVTTVYEGDPLHDPSGVAIAQSGTIYVVDASSPTSTHASIVRISGGAASVFVDGIAAGYPAGVTLSQAESTLLVSALDPAKGTDTVLVIDVASANVSMLSQGIDTFVEPAGLHRAKGSDIFAWADSQANSTGTVYVLAH